MLSLLVTNWLMLPPLCGGDSVGQFLLKNIHRPSSAHATVILHCSVYPCPFVKDWLDLLEGFLRRLQQLSAVQVERAVRNIHRNLLTSDDGLADNYFAATGIH